MPRKDPEKRREYMREWWRRTKDNNKEYRKDYAKAYHAKRSVSDKPRRDAYNKMYKSGWHGRYINFKTRNGTYRGLSFEINEHDFKMICSSPCCYCGETEKKRSLDRVDSSLSYTISNVVACCVMCNRMKSNFSLKDFLNQVEKINSNIIRRQYE